MFQLTLLVFKRIVFTFPDKKLENLGLRRPNRFEAGCADWDTDPKIVNVVLDLIGRDCDWSKQNFTVQTFLQSTFQTTPDAKNNFHPNFNNDSGEIVTNLQSRINWLRLSSDDYVKTENLLLDMSALMLQRKIVFHTFLEANLQSGETKTFGGQFQKSYDIFGYRSNHHNSLYISTFSIKEKLSKPKPFKVSDGVSNVGIVVDSIENLEERTKQVLNLPQSVRISIKTKTQPSKLIESKMDLDNLKANEILNIIPKGPIIFTPENLLKKLTRNPRSLVLFTDRDFVTISEINIEAFESQYPQKRLEELKQIANEHIAKDQELRDALDLVQLSKSHTEKGDEAAKTNESIETLSKVDVKKILKEVKENYGKIFKVSDEELESLASMDEEDMTLVDKQIKAAASRRLRIKRKMEMSKEYLSSNRQEPKEGESTGSQQELEK